MFTCLFSWARNPPPMAARGRPEPPGAARGRPEPPGAARRVFGDPDYRCLVPDNYARVVVRMKVQVYSGQSNRANTSTHVLTTTRA